MHLLEWVDDYCLAKPQTTVSTPFGPDTLVYKVAGKIFALVSLDEEYPSVNLKNTPDRNIELREAYEGIEAGYHMDKKHWNTLRAHLLKVALIKELIDESYACVVARLPKKLQSSINTGL